MRKYFIDNLRWMSILLLFPFHTCMIYNNYGENFYIKSSGVSLLTGFIQVTYTWFMPLLFVIAGISTCYALNKRTPGQYIRERVLKLFIPLISGILLLVPIQTFYAEKFHNGYTGGYLHQYVLFFTKKTDLTGYTGGFTPGHLWFILYLFIISLVALPIVLIYKKSSKKMRIDKLSVFSILPMFIIFLAMALVFNTGGKSLGGYFALFMLGYFILSDDAIQSKIDMGRWYLTAGFVILTVFNILFQNVWHCSFGIIYDIFTGFLTWIAVLALLGMGKHYLDFHNKITGYFTKASFPIYIFHQSLVVLTAYYTLKITSSVAEQVVIIISVSFILTMLVYEITRRIPFMRFLFAMK